MDNINYTAIHNFSAYIITVQGLVFSKKSEKFLRPMITRKGYYLVALYDKGKRHYKSIARLVAQAFIPNPENKPEVNHKNGIKTDNFKSNLEWATSKENIQHAFATGLRINSPNAGRKAVPINVYEYITGEYKSTHLSINDAVRIYGLSQGNVTEVLKGNRKQTKGLTFIKTH